MITMVEIDMLRKEADDATEALREAVRRAPLCPECEQGVACWAQTELEGLAIMKREAEANVLTALRIYWEQKGIVR